MLLGVQPHRLKAQEKPSSLFQELSLNFLCFNRDQWVSSREVPAVHSIFALWFLGLIFKPFLNRHFNSSFIDFPHTYTASVLFAQLEQIK